MKKILFLLAMLPVLVFSACSDDDDNRDGLLPSGMWYVTNGEGSSYLNTREEHNNWISIDFSNNTISLLLSPNLGAVISFNGKFTVNGNTIECYNDYSDYPKIVLSSITSTTAKAEFYEDDIIGKEYHFPIYMRKK
jgi:hypothetical protein